MHRMRGATFERVTSFSMDDTLEYRDRALLNQKNVLRWIDNLQRELSEFRRLVERQDGEAIAEYYQIEMENRLQWLQDWSSQNWGDMPERTEIPTAGEFMGEMFFGGLARRRRDN
jgi:hypothetical protein